MTQDLDDPNLWSGTSGMIQSTQLDDNSRITPNWEPPAGSTFPSASPTLTSCTPPSGATYTVTGVITGTPTTGRVPVQVTFAPGTGAQLPTTLAVSVTLNFGSRS